MGLSAAAEIIRSMLINIYVDWVAQYVQDRYIKFEKHSLKGKAFLNDSLQMLQMILCYLK